MCGYCIPRNERLHKPIKLKCKILHRAFTIVSENDILR